MLKAGSDFPFLTESYHRIRQAQTEKAVAAQLQRLADIAQGVKPSTPRRLFPPHPLPPPAVNPTINLTPAYAAGSPNPEYRFNATTGQIQNSGPGISAFAFGDPKLGRISLGADGGISLWGIFTPLTGLWLLGDATTVSASLFAYARIENVDVPQKAASLECVAEVWNSVLLAEFGTSGSLICFPGKAGAALSGFVGVTGAIDVTATLLSRGLPVVSESSSDIFLEIAVNSQKPGTNDKPFDATQFLTCAWQFDAESDRTIRGSVSLPARHGSPLIDPAVMVEVTIRLTGARGGVADPAGGSFAFDFADADHGKDPLAFSSADGFFAVPLVILDPIF